MDSVHQEQTDIEIMTEFFRSLDRCLSSGHRFTLFGDEYIHAYSGELIEDNQGNTYSPISSGVFLFAAVNTPGKPETERPILTLGRDDFLQYIFNNNKEEPVSAFKAESDKMRFLLLNAEDKERVYYTVDEDLLLRPR